MIRAAVDKNQPAIVAALREAGATVQMLYGIGHGCPDIVVGFQGINYLMEIKNPHGRKRLTFLQGIWHERWRGQAAVVSTIAAALHIIGVDHEEIYRSSVGGGDAGALEEDCPPGGDGCRDRR